MFVELYRNAIDKSIYMYMYMYIGDYSSNDFLHTILFCIEWKSFEYYITNI